MGGGRYSIEQKMEIPMCWKQIDGTKPEDVRKLSSIIFLPGLYPTSSSSAHCLAATNSQQCHCIKIYQESGWH